eukprot:scaffold2872_cov112-Isochrysis_galbana.AAC.11
MAEGQQQREHEHTQHRETCRRQCAWVGAEHALTGRWRSVHAVLAHAELSPPSWLARHVSEKICIRFCFHRRRRAARQGRLRPPWTSIACCHR